MTFVPTEREERLARKWATKLMQVERQSCSGFREFEPFYLWWRRMRLPVQMLIQEILRDGAEGE